MNRNDRRLPSLTWDLCIPRPFSEKDNPSTEQIGFLQQEPDTASARCAAIDYYFTISIRITAILSRAKAPCRPGNPRKITIPGFQRSNSRCDKLLSRISGAEMQVTGGTTLVQTGALPSQVPMPRWYTQPRESYAVQSSSTMKASYERLPLNFK